MSDPLDLSRRLRESGTATGGRPFDLRVIAPDTLFDAADLIERQHAELTRLRAVEEAAMDVVAADLIDGVWLRDKWIPALRAALREKGAESE